MAIDYLGQVTELLDGARSIVETDADAAGRKVLEARSLLSDAPGFHRIGDSWRGAVSHYKEQVNGINQELEEQGAGFGNLSIDYSPEWRRSYKQGQEVQVVGREEETHENGIDF